MLKAMIYWNPLYDVSIERQSLKFIGEESGTEFFFPTGMTKYSQLWGRLEDGIDFAMLQTLNVAEREVVRSLFEKGFLATLNEKPSSGRTNRSLGHFLSFSASPERCLERVQESTVCILGVGGVGSVVLQHLVAAGVKKFILLDCDVVEPSNLNRQHIYSLADVGRRKIDAAVDFIRSRSKNCAIQIFHSKIHSLKSLLALDMPECDLIANCLDTPRGEVDDIVHGFGEMRETPVIGAGVGVIYGHWGPLLSPTGGVTFQDWKRANLKSVPSATPEKPTRWSFGPTNTLVSTHMVFDIINWLSGKKDVLSFNRRVVVRFDDNQTILSRSL